MRTTSKSPSTTDNGRLKRPKLPPVHPGEILKETLDDLGISMNRLAQEIRVPANRISAIVAGQRAVSAETALRLGRYFNVTPAYWINMQARYDLETARDEWEARIASEVQPRNAA
jgi:addiction module HigA family antidote